MLTVIGFLLTITLGALVNIWVFRKINNQNSFRLNERQSIKGYPILLGLSIFFYFIVFLWWAFDIRLLGFHGFKVLFIVGAMITMAFYGIINKEVISEFQKRLALGYSIIPYLYFSVALIPYIGYLIVFSPMARILGTEREVKFENEQYRLEQIESVVMSGGRYNFFLVEKRSYYEKVITTYYADRKRYDDIKDIRIEKGRIHFER